MAGVQSRRYEGELGEAVAKSLETGECACAVFADFRALLLFAGDAEVIAVDIPIGFLDAAQHGGRPCDIEARKLLGGSRASSVFSPPVRATLAAGSYPAARPRLEGPRTRRRV